MEKTNLKDLSLQELEAFLRDLGEEKFRAKQIRQWLYKGIVSLEEMNNIPKRLRLQLEQNATTGASEILKVQESKIDGTKKYLLGLNDGSSIETVFMKYKHGNSICISSQAGCRMGCRFCASTVGGLKRQLTAGEMIEQIIAVERHTKEKISNIVVMGTGEPFDNYENLSRFILLANSENGLNIGMRSITVSTCGIIPVIQKFAEDFPQVNLAVSLHAPTDEIRNLTMPINKKYPMGELLRAVKEYTEKTGRRVTFEYALVKGLNDSREHCNMLAGALRGILCHVNLIPLNNVEENNLKGSSRKHAQEFKMQLENLGITATVRRELGSDIDAACGQLRLKSQVEKI